jgi:hypothetical protein
MPWSFMINYGFSVEEISPITIIIERLFVPVKQLQGIGNDTVIKFKPALMISYFHFTIICVTIFPPRNEDG